MSLNIIHTNTTGRKKTHQRDYCCLQFSFFSLGFERAALSVCRLVGGMNVASSWRSRRPADVIGRDWLPAPEWQREGSEPRVIVIKVSFWRPCYYRSVPSRCRLGPGAWPGRLGPTPRRRSSYAEFACQPGGVSQRDSTAGRCASGGDTYIVEVGLGGTFSGQQSSVGDGRPSESSLSRWTWVDNKNQRVLLDAAHK